MKDTPLPSREGRARPGTGPASRLRRSMLRMLVLLAGLLATVSRAAVVVAEASAATPLVHRAAGVAGVVLEVLDDPLHALAVGALVTTIAGSIAAWRRSVGAGVTVAAALFAALGLAGKS